MDDSCAVCAESLEWVAYGACGHKDVCSTCVARLRFICNDRRCCICKTETDVVFVTKALGDYTKSISDFTVFPSELREGRVGQYWYHGDTQAFFDDSDHYKMIEAMCRLSCSECDKVEDQSGGGSRRKARFRNIDQLKNHLYHQHNSLMMCSLCLEGRKVFICEQKLYTKQQLRQHIETGDSKVDGTENERGGFKGHPTCRFCQTSFYGENEQYTHMSTEHYTCHLCPRQHPGLLEYFKNYDDLEMHFRHDHFLCEDDSCLAKKFIVFKSESEIKRHNAKEHGGRMSRSQRSAALQIPTSFQYRRSTELENRRGRGRGFRRDVVDSEISLAIQASLETAGADNGGSADVNSLISPLESMATTGLEAPSRYRQAVSQSSVSGTLGDSSFPPLASGSGGNQQSSQTDALSKNTMAAHLRRQSKKATNSSSSTPAWPAASRTTVQPFMSSQTQKKVSSSSSTPGWQTASRTPAPPVSTSHAWPPVNAIPGSASSSGQSRAFPEIKSVSSSHSTSAQIHPPSVATTSFAGHLMSSKASGSTNRLSHSSSAPSLSERESFESSRTDFPPVSAVAQPRKPTIGDQAIRKAANVHTANQTLVEKMRAALGSDEDKFTAFKDISSEYRLGSIDVETYLTYVDQFGLSHLVLDLAGLLPNAQKQKELIDAYNLHMAFGSSREDGRSNGIKDGYGSQKGKGKGKSVDSGNSSVKNNLADNVINTVRQLQSSYKAPVEDVEVLSKDGYRSSRGQSNVINGASPLEITKPKSQTESSYAVGGSNQNPTNGNGKGKQRKKTSKFLRARLGDGSVEALLDLKNSDPDLDPDSDPGEASSNGGDGNVPVSGVWKNGGGQKLLSTTKRRG